MARSNVPTPSKDIPMAKLLLTRHSIRRRLLTWVIGVTGLLLVAIVIWSMFLGHRRIVGEMRSKAAFLAEGGAARVDRHLAPMEGFLRALALSIEFNEFNLASAQIDTLIRSAMAEKPGIFGMCLAMDPQWPLPTDWTDRAAYWHREGATIAYLDLAGPLNAHTAEPWFYEPMNSGQGHWSEPYIETSIDQPMVTFSVPLRVWQTDADRIQRNTATARTVGVLTFDLTIEWLDGLLSDLPFGPDGYGFLMSRESTYIAHPLPELVVHASVFSIAAERGDEDLAALGHQMVSGQPGLRSWYSFRTGDPCWLAYTPLQSANWIMGAIVSKDELHSALRHLFLTQSAMGLIGLLALIGAVSMIARTITVPIERLRDAADQLTGGQLDIALPMPRGKDEVAQLTFALSGMRDRLQEHIRSLAETTAARERMQSELRIAHDIQMGLVPKTFPALPSRPDLDLFAILEPAREVGGDFYDFFQLDEDHMVVAIGDVSDKGVPAALFMAVTRSFLRSFFRGEQQYNPAEVMQRVNSELAQGNDACMFVTLFCAVVRFSDGNVTYANAGHNPPLLRLPDGTLTFIHEPSGAIAGAMPNLTFENGTLELPTDGTLILYTDGVTEAMNPDGEWFGESGLEASVHATPTNACSEAVITQLLKDIRAFAGEAPQSDDITMLLLRRRCPANDATPSGLFIQFANNQRELEHALDQLEERLNESHPQLAQIARLVLEEMGTNIIKYGYDDSEPHLVQVRFKAGPPAQLIIEDDGHPFNPLQDAPTAAIDAELEDRPIGGLGIHMVKTMTAAQSYRRSDGRNRFCVTFQNGVGPLQNGVGPL